MYRPRYSYIDKTITYVRYTKTHHFTIILHAGIQILSFWFFKIKKKDYTSIRFDK